jgi:hypothetical protein
MTTQYLRTDDGLISERYLIRLDHLADAPDVAWFITYALGTKAVQTRAAASAVTEFLNTLRT